jgi:hypothetical protein
MLFINRRRDLAMIVGLVGLMLSVAGLGVLPTLAQTSFNLQYLQLQNKMQSVEVRDAAGTDLGSFEFTANVSINRNGTLPSGNWQTMRLTGFSESWRLEIQFTQLEAIIRDENNDPVGATLSGRGTLSRDGLTSTFPTTVTVRHVPSVPDCLIWDIPGNPVLDGLQFESVGELRIRER